MFEGLSARKYYSGCPCHLIHLAAEKAAGEFPVSVEELLIDLYYFFFKSAKRKEELKEIQELCGVPFR